MRMPSASGLNRNFAHRLKIEIHQMLRRIKNCPPGDRFNDPGHIVADEAELGAPPRLLHGSPQR